MIYVHPDFAAYREHIERICGLLELDNIRVLPHHDHSHVVSDDPDTVYICEGQVLDLGMHIVRICAHELRHVQQMRDGRLCWFYELQAMVWDDSIYSLGWIAAQPHELLPWEANAIEFESWYIDTFGRELETSETREMHAMRALAA